MCFFNQLYAFSDNFEAINEFMKCTNQEVSEEKPEKNKTEKNAVSIQQHALSRGGVCRLLSSCQPYPNSKFTTKKYHFT